MLDNAPQTMNLQELKQKTPAALLEIAEELEIENASSLRKQDLMFTILKEWADQDVVITGDGVLELIAGRVRVLDDPRILIICRDQMISIWHLRKSAGLACGPGIRSAGKFGHQRMVSGTSHWSK